MSEKARKLRKNFTDAENALWQELRGRRFSDVKFRRQHPIGKYIADFACVERHLVIEVDGGQHAENSADLRRTARLNEKGWAVMRFWNDEVLLNRDGVLLRIREML